MFPNLHEKTFAGVLLLIKLQPATLFEKTTTQVLFRELYRILKNKCFPKTSDKGCFCLFSKISFYTKNINKQMWNAVS